MREWFSEPFLAINMTLGWDMTVEIFSISDLL